MSLLRIVDSPLSWALAGFAIGLGLGVNSASVWLMAIGLGVFVAYVWRHGDARHETEGRLFAAAPVFIVSWIVGFVVRGLVF